MSITPASIPESLRTNKSVAPYIARATEIESVNIVVAYYCKIYVLEYILSNKLHTSSKEVERFTIELLDDTESIKNGAEDSVKQALNDKAISAGIILAFAYKLFNGSVESINKFSKAHKTALVAKIRATLVFLSLLDVFVANKDIDWGKLSGGKAQTGEEFEKGNKEKIKVLKWQLSRLLKDEVPEANQNEAGDQDVVDQELEDELNKELANLESTEGAGEESGTQTGEVETDRFLANEIAKDDSGPILPSAPTELRSVPNDNTANGPRDFPSAPYDAETSSVSAPNDTDNASNGPEGLPTAPHILPDEDNEFKLPGAPKYLPDDDLSHINKSSSIQIIPPEKPTAEDKKHAEAEHPKKLEPKKPNPVRTASQVTKADVSSIIDRTELISKIQKHAKFAVSALNYEDLETAERELKQGLELLELLKLS